MKYKIEITETLQRVVEVEAETPETAEKIVKELYDEGEIILDDMDFIGSEIKQYKE